MKLALYCPVYGYYEKEKDNLGRAGDFFTNVSVGSLFGELLGFQFAEWLHPVLHLNSTLHIVEAGAHDGRFAKDVLTWMRSHQPKLFESIGYVIVEPSEIRRAWQQQTLDKFRDRVQWVERVNDLKNRSSHGIHGIIFSNELLDAMPVHRIGWNASRKKWFEWGVTLSGDQFAWQKMDQLEAHVRLPDFPSDLLDQLPDEFTTEVGVEAVDWWREAAGVLLSGRLMTIDYGLGWPELLSPQRSAGTLRTYVKHHSGQDLLSEPGRQDITAHANFEEIQTAGEASGLKTDLVFSQEKFFTQVAERTWKRAEEFGEWTPQRVRQLQTLIHPEHLGRAFQVLVQSRQIHPMDSLAAK
jgi:SAM-dependent MidA family methyltransferase